MDHSHMSMTSSAMPAATSGAGGGMGGGHGGHGGMGGNACKISMLWNWNVINSCFISSSWRITSKGMFAGSCIGVVLLVMSLEFLRRLGNEFDKHIAGQPSLFVHFLPKSMLQTNAHHSSSTQQLKQPDDNPTKSPSTTSTNEAGVANSNGCSGQAAATHVALGSIRRRPTLLQHTLRSLLHMVQFGVAYFVMLLAMYYNGYFIICILIGSFLGSFVFSWTTGDKNDACAVTVCCG